VTKRLSARSDFGEEEGGQDGQLVWWGDQVTDPSDEPIVMHFHKDGSAHLLDPAEDVERLVLGRVTPDRGRPAQRTPAIVADRASRSASLQLSQLVPLASRQARHVRP
jgi:hypothetical protein